ncbi:MAG: ABC transporter permease [Deltaproteobacteria bacterium]|nr:ABC transporter permease [Deltaproteobacteria bacterium]
MKTILTIAKREFKAYFQSPIAYIYLVTFLVLVHWIFLRGFFVIGQGNLRSFFTLLPWVYLFFVPAVAMGKWSEERKQGTIELLFTMPISETQILLGKFLAGLGLLSVALFLTFPLPVTIALIGKIDLGPMIGGYLGLLFLGGAYLAIGLWVSALTDNQIIAFILGVLVCFALFIIGEPLVTSGLPPMLVSLLQYAGLGSHFESIGRGVIDSRDCIYYISVISLFLFFNLKALEARAWR